MEKRTHTFGAKISEQLLSRLENIEELYGPSSGVIAVDALTALADYVEKAGAYRRPMRMVWAGDLERLEVLASQAPDEGHRHLRVAEAPCPVADPHHPAGEDLPRRPV